MHLKFYKSSIYWCVIQFTITNTLTFFIFMSSILFNLALSLFTISIIILDNNIYFYNQNSLLMKAIQHGRVSILQFCYGYQPMKRISLSIYSAQYIRSIHFFKKIVSKCILQISFQFFEDNSRKILIFVVQLLIYIKKIVYTPKTPNIMTAVFWKMFDISLNCW